MMERGYERLGLPYRAGDLARSGFGAYRAKTGRSQPQAKEFLPARANWWRTLVTPPSPDWSIGYFDYKNQEFGYAAYSSGDPNMIADYENRLTDPYVAFGHRSGIIPPGGTRFSHPKERTAAKPIVLGSMYGRQALSIGAVLAAKLHMERGDATVLATDLLRHHRKAYPTFWQWIEDGVDVALLTGEMTTPLGWRMAVGDPAYELFESDHWTSYGTKATTLFNWRMQAGGGDIMRVAAAQLVHSGVDVIWPVHDAFMIICQTVDREEIGRATVSIMEEASAAVLGGPVIPVDMQWIGYGQTWRDPEKGDAMWNRIFPAVLRARKVA